MKPRRKGMVSVESLMIIAVGAMILMGMTESWKEDLQPEAELMTEVVLGQKKEVELSNDQIFQRPSDYRNFNNDNPNSSSKPRNKYEGGKWTNPTPYDPVGPVGPVIVKLDGKELRIPVYKADWIGTEEKPGGQYLIENGEAKIYISKDLETFDILLVWSHERIHARQDAIDGQLNGIYHKVEERNPTSETALNRAEREAEAYEKEGWGIFNQPNKAKKLKDAAAEIKKGNFEKAETIANKNPDVANDIRLTIEESKKLKR